MLWYASAAGARSSRNSALAGRRQATPGPYGNQWPVVRRTARQALEIRHHAERRQLELAPDLIGRLERAVEGLQGERHGEPESAAEQDAKRKIEGNVRHGGRGGTLGGIHHRRVREPHALHDVGLLEALEQGAIEIPGRGDRLIELEVLALRCPSDRARPPAGANSSRSFCSRAWAARYDDSTPLTARLISRESRPCA